MGIKAVSKVYFWNGQCVELENEAGEVYLTQIIHQENNDYFLIQQPISYQEERMNVSNEQLITVFFYDDERGLSMCQSYLRNDHNRLLLYAPARDAVKNVYHRRFFRVFASVNMDITESTSQLTQTPRPLTTKDISGGGLSFMYPFAMEKDTIIGGNLYLSLNDTEHHVPFNGRVVRSKALPNHPYKISLEFVDMSEAVRTVIIRFCMMRQIELRNKLKDA